MFNSKPTLSELPSSKQLLRSTVIALIIAIVLLVTVVMPSEYAIDPTGAGRLMGLTQMGEIKQQLAGEAAAEVAAPIAQATAAEQPVTQPAPQPAEVSVVDSALVPTGSESAGQKHEMSITLAPGQGAEVKLEMVKGAKVEYFWTANGGQVNFDTHGDPYNAPRDFYHGYGKGRFTSEDRGILEAAFDGHHGWFWRNRTKQPVTVTLLTEGEYVAIKRVI